MTEPLDNARAKLQRASDTLDELFQQIQQAGASRSYGFSLRIEQRYGVGDLVVRALIPHALLDHVSAAAAEIIGDTRTALDDAVWEMVPDPVEGKTAFPVFGGEDGGEDGDYDTAGVAMIEGINPDAASVIKSVQPFGPNKAWDPMFVVHELWKISKHRPLATGVGYLQGMTLVYKSQDGTRDSSKFVKVPPDVKDGDELFRDRRPLDKEVTGEGALLDIVFEEDPARGQLVAPLLKTLIMFTDDVLGALAKTL